MANDYQAVYRKLVDGETRPALRGRGHAVDRAPVDPIPYHRGLLGPVGNVPAA
jgi:hypothetical protein